MKLDKYLNEGSNVIKVANIKSIIEKFDRDLTAFQVSFKFDKDTEYLNDTLNDMNEVLNKLKKDLKKASQDIR